MSFDLVLIWLPPVICFAAIWGLLSFFVWSAWQAIREGTVHLKRLHAIPCDRCVYFTGDFRLKCTVRPIEAMTEEALGCRDFEPITKPIPLQVPQRACGGCSKRKSSLCSSENSLVNLDLKNHPQNHPQNHSQNPKCEIDPFAPIEKTLETMHSSRS